MKKNFLLLLTALVLTSSCGEQFYYQVYEVSSPDVKQEDKVLVYENADCRVTYNLWSNGGNLNFLFQNKTQKNIYIAMPMSFFILNGIANDYYSNSTHSKSVTSSIIGSSAGQVSLSGYVTNSKAWYPTTTTRESGMSIGFSKTEGVTITEMPYVCIPPLSSKFIRGFNISDYVYMDCENRKANYPNYTSPIVSYDKINSPLEFRNRIAYTFDENSGDVNYIDNNFHVTSFINYSEKAAFEVKNERPCNSQYVVKRKYFKISAPNKFYNIYKFKAN